MKKSYNSISTLLKIIGVIIMLTGAAVALIVYLINMSTLMAFVSAFSIVVFGALVLGVSEIISLLQNIADGQNLILTQLVKLPKQ